MTDLEIKELGMIMVTAASRITKDGGRDDYARASLLMSIIAQCLLLKCTQEEIIERTGIMLEDYKKNIDSIINKMYEGIDFDKMDESIQQTHELVKLLIDE